MRGNRDSSQRRRASATSPPLGGASECFPGRSSDLQVQTYLPDFPSHRLSVILAFVPAYRCGAAPDFHRIPFSLPITRDRGTDPLYLALEENYNLYRLWISRRCSNKGNRGQVPRGIARPCKMTACRSSPDWGLLNGKLVGIQCCPAAVNGNETLHGGSQRTASGEDGKRQWSRQAQSPKTGLQPPPWKRWALTVGALRMPFSGTGPVATASFA